MRVIDDVEALDALEADWERLAAEDGGAGASVFRGWPWNRLWWKHYAHLGTLHVLVVVRDGDTVCGIAPFYHTRTRALQSVRLKTLRFIGSGGDTSPDDLDVLVERERRDAIVDLLCRTLLADASVERFELRDLRPESAFARAFPPCAVAVGLPAPSWQLERRLVDELPSSVAAWREAAGRNARRRSRRRLNRLRRTGEGAFAPCRTPEEVARAYAALVELHRARRASLGERGGFGSPSYVAFHEELTRALLRRGELRLATLALDGEIVAVEYGFATGGTLAFFQTGFDPARAALAPGHLLMTWMIERGIEDGLERIDLLKGNYAYKGEYARRWRETRSIELYRSAPLARLVALARRLRAALASAFAK